MEWTLTDTQRDLADARAHAVLAIAAVPEPLGGFMSIRSTGDAAKRAGVVGPDGKAEQAMFRSAGYGRFRTGTLRGTWEVLVNAADEASRGLGEPIDLISVSRQSLAWCLAGKPDGPLRRLHETSLRIVTDDVHIESPDRPHYRHVLDGWREVFAVES